TGFLCLLLMGAAAGPAHGDSLSPGELAKSADGIRLDVQARPLNQVIEALSEQTGIRFQYPANLAATPLTATLQAPDWPTLVQGLFKDFSKIEFWSESLQESRVKILGIGDYDPSPVTATLRSARQVPSLPGRRAPRVVNSASNRVQLAAQSGKPGHPLEKLPIHVFMEPGVLHYLVNKRVDIPDSLKWEYGIDPNNLPPNLPIPDYILNDPALREYLNGVNLPLPPQFPESGR
ncbi:MAG: hypothetical protein ACE5ER_08845, partial [Nitrospinaceae bacterium]